MEKNEIRLDGTESIKNLLLCELKEIIYFDKAPYIKFVLIVNAIEYLGASFDAFPYGEPKHSETRFNDALKKLFPKAYHKYAKADADIYLYEDLRCGFVHQFRPKTPNIHLTTRKEAVIEKTTHLENREGHLYIVLEDFYDDLAKAVNKLLKLDSEGKSPSKKLKEDFITVQDESNTGTTETKM